MSGATLPHDWYSEPLPENVTIGERSWLHSSYAFLHYRSKAKCGVRIGSDTGIYKGTFFDLGPQGEVSIGDFCTIVAAILRTNGRVLVEDYAFIAHEVVIGDSAFGVPDSDDTQSAVISVGRNAWIGARAVLLSGARIGEGAIVGAGAVVNFDVPAYAIAAGNPASIVGAAPPRAGS